MINNEIFTFKCKEPTIKEGNAEEIRKDMEQQKSRLVNEFNITRRMIANFSIAEPHILGLNFQYESGLTKNIVNPEYEI